VTDFVLDNSVSMRWCFENATHAYADSLLSRLEAGEKAIVPVLWLYEVSAVLARAQNLGSLAAAKASEFIGALRALNIAIDSDGTERILTDVHRLAIAHRLTSYDAAYLELALRQNLPLATLDADLIRACQQAGAVVV
jgi:predicted nucleic acid-binding protein